MARYNFRLAWLSAQFIIIEEAGNPPIIISPEGLALLLDDLDLCIFDTKTQRDSIYTKYVSAMRYYETHKPAGGAP